MKIITRFSIIIILIFSLLLLLGRPTQHNNYNILLNILNGPNFYLYLIILVTISTFFTVTFSLIKSLSCLSMWFGFLTYFLSLNGIYWYLSFPDPGAMYISPLIVCTCASGVVSIVFHRLLQKDLKK